MKLISRINFKTIGFLALLCLSAKGFAQETENSTIEKQEASKLADVEIKPEFPGGMNGFYKFVGKTFNMPLEASKNKVQGKVYLQFIIEKDGSVNEAIILKDMGYGLGDEAARVLKLSPKWTPASINGKRVRVMYSLPIMIST